MDARTAARQEFIPLMRELVRAYQAFTHFDAAGYQDVGLTVAQADVIFTLGNTDGLTCKEIGAKTLITKGTLTGVINRLEAKGLVERWNCTQDRRCIRARLTAEGTALFEEVFPRQIQRLKARFDRLDTAEQAAARESLERLKAIF